MTAHANAYTRLVDALRAAGSTVVERVDKATAQCPAHDDNTPSLSIKPRDDGAGVVLHCHAGCEYIAVLAALGLHPCDLYNDDAAMRDVYKPNVDYRYSGGRVNKRRTSPETGKKSFTQTGADDKSLYCAEKIPPGCLRVYLCESEKGAQAIWAMGAAAVSTGGASRLDCDLAPLQGAEVVVVVDRDQPGLRWARAYRDRLAGVAASVRFVRCAVDIPKADVVEHIDAGHDLDQLEKFDPAASGDSEPQPDADALRPEDTGVDGAELLDDISEFAGKFFAFPTRHHLVALTLWILHTWAVSAFYVTPRLVIDSPEPGCGKTRVLEVLVLLCRSAKLTLSTTTAALYRRIDAAGDQPPTVLQDEADAVFGSKAPMAEDLRALFNSGYKRGATVDRCEGDAKKMRVREFPVFAPVALAGLAGKMSKTVLDRAVVFHMRHRAPDEKVAPFRERIAAAEAGQLRRRLEAWAEAAFDALAAALPEMPAGVEDRPAEVWEALLAVADVAGGDWPQRARDACRHFVLDADEDELSLGVRLLRDVRKAFGDSERMFSVDVITHLTGNPELEWADLWGKALDQARLAKELKRYGVRSHTVRIGNARAKGYAVDGEDGLAQAWRRYLPSTIRRDTRDSGDFAGQRVTASNSSRDTRDMSRLCRDKRDMSVTTETMPEQQLFDNVTDVTDVTATDGREGEGANGVHASGGLQLDLAPGAPTPRTPGQTERMRRALAAGRANAQPGGNCSLCNEPLWAPASIERGLCARCHLAATPTSASERADEELAI